MSQSQTTFSIIKPDAVSTGKASDKIKAMEEAGIAVCSSPADIGEKIQSRL